MSVVRLCLVILLTAACGRVGFSEHDASGARDSAADATLDTRTADGSSADGAADGAADVTGDGALPMGALPELAYLRFQTAQFADGSMRSAGAGEMIGDLHIRMMRPGQWEVSLRTALLEDSVPTTAPTVTSGRLTAEPLGRYHFDPVDPLVPEVVLIIVITGDSWVMRVDAEDPRTMGSDSYAQVVVMGEETAPPTLTAGSWALESLTDADMTVPAGTCSAFGADFVVSDAGWSIDGPGATMGFQMHRVYSDASCMTETLRVDAIVSGFIVERPGNVADVYVWNEAEATGIYARYDYDEPSPDRLRLRIRECLPDCEIVDELLFRPGGGGG